MVCLETYVSMWLLRRLQCNFAKHCPSYNFADFESHFNRNIGRSKCLQPMQKFCIDTTTALSKTNSQTLLLLPMMMNVDMLSTVIGTKIATRAKMIPTTTAYTMNIIQPSVNKRIYSRWDENLKHSWSFTCSSLGKLFCGEARGIPGCFQIERKLENGI